MKAVAGDGNGVRVKRENNDVGGCVVYWMSRDQRVSDNWALLYAQERACQLGVPVAVVFNVVPKFLEASARQFCFMLKGLREVEQELTNAGIPFFVLTGDPVVNVPHFAQEHNVKVLVADYSPLHTPMEAGRGEQSRGATLRR